MTSSHIFPNVLYVMGAGRSGTTILAVILGNSCSGINLGEFNQLPEHVKGEKSCSCGESLSSCPFWGQKSAIRNKRFASDVYLKQRSQLEPHRKILRYFLCRQRGRKFAEYMETNSSLFEEVGEQQRSVVDSSKYMGRGLALNSMPDFEIRYIYLVRDPRGVVNSFEKPVQSSRGWISATFYYIAINTVALLVSKTLLRKRVIKAKYEDLLCDPADFLNQIGSFTGIDVSEPIRKIQANEEFQTGHMVGGNRIVENASIHFNPNDNWRENMPTWKRLAVWLLTLPLNIINGYSP